MEDGRCAGAACGSWSGKFGHSTVFCGKGGSRFSTKLRHILFEKIESLSFSKMDTVGTSTLITRMTSDINQVQSGVNLVLRLFLRSPFIVFGAMAMAFTVNVRAAMVLLLPYLCFQ